MSTNAESGASPAAHEPTTPKSEPAAKHRRDEVPAKRITPKGVHGSRTGYTWIGLLAAAIIGIVLLVFIIQNLDQAKVTLLFWDFSLPLGITVLLSVIAGALVMGLVGGVRILQLRHAAKKP
ncbi:LapA family protein [Nocardia neocaledoniensis]|uniref:LapA family protein n=1 Tax=Nocardia neocaledoniensis TaxID=236511 RepID=UPI0024560132|nr:lipopolysaccharide assembly protein LapA domain-containing protein [Nocardia neocaledoniensis]